MNRASSQLSARSDDFENHILDSLIESNLEQPCKYESGIPLKTCSPMNESHDNSYCSISNNMLAPNY